MNKKHEALKLALVALESTDKLSYECWMRGYGEKAITAIKEALAQPELHWYCVDKSGVATLCAGEDDALQLAKNGALIYPNNAPYRAVQLCEYRPVETEQEPVASLWRHGVTAHTRIITPDMITDCDANWIKVSDLYTAPPKREWVGLTFDQKNDLSCRYSDRGDVVKNTEAKLKELNHD